MAKRDRILHLRVHDGEYDEIAAQAAASDVPVSRVLRDRLRAVVPSPHVNGARGEPATAKPITELAAAPETHVLPLPVWHIDDLGADHLRLRNGALRK